jgi:hypothetical protein
MLTNGKIQQKILLSISLSILHINTVSCRDERVEFREPTWETETSDRSKCRPLPPIFEECESLKKYPEPVFLNVYGAQESIPRNESASLRSLAGRYDNPIPPRFLALTL